MNKHKIHTGGVVSLIVLLFFTFAGSAFAADCLAVRKRIQQETDLLKKRKLVQEGLTNCPNDPVINFKYAYSLERFRKYDEALKHYQAATKLDPKYAKAYFGMGDMYLQLGRPQESVAAYQEGLSIDPNNKRAARSMQEALAQTKQSPDTKTTAVIPHKPSPPKEKVIPATTPATVKTPKHAAPTGIIPYSPETKTIFQTPQNQIPVVTTPLGKETIQTFSFSKAGHSDATGSLDDNLMGSK
jgi:tetratricopeptide (TPR) repeat protein